MKFLRRVTGCNKLDRYRNAEIREELNLQLLNNTIRQYRPSQNQYLGSSLVWQERGVFDKKGVADKKDLRISFEELEQAIRRTDGIQKIINIFAKYSKLHTKKKP